MNKHLMCSILFPVLSLLLTGCMAKPAAPVPPASTLPTVQTQPTAAKEPDESLPYTQYIDRADQSIYQGAGYDYVFVDTVRQPGTYTIVEEATDYEGNLWGRLKSGIGWVDLTEIRSGNYVSDLLSANYADTDLLSDTYLHCPSSEEYSIPIAFRAYGPLQNVTVFRMDFCADGYVPGAELFTLPELTEQIPLVAELAFPGDMSTYGIRFTDEAGHTHSFLIYISGRNGAMMLAPMTP